MSPMYRPVADLGYALVVVLWLLTLLSTITMGYHASARTEAKLLTNEVYRAQAEAAAEAAIWLSLRDRLSSGARTLAIAAETLPPVEFAGAVVHVKIADVAGRVNLNRARSDLLAHAFTRSRLLAAERKRVVDAILDWRDPDDSRLPNGAEDDDYARAGLGYEAKDAAFATVDELRYVIGMTDEAFRAIEPMLTVYGNHSRVDPHAADPSLLSALPGADPAQIEDFVGVRSSDDARQTRIPPSIDRRFLQNSGENIYVVTSTATIGPASATIEAVVRAEPREDPPVQVLAWRSGAAPTLDEGSSVE